MAPARNAPARRRAATVSARQPRLHLRHVGGDERHRAVAGRPFAAKTLATASVENGSAARPYSVSVGIATIRPARISFAASWTASRWGRSGFTNTRRMLIFQYVTSP